MHLFRPSVPAFMRTETLFTRYLENFLTDFHQTYVIDASWDRQEHIKFWDQKVKVQGHDGIKYPRNSSL